MVRTCRRTVSRVIVCGEQVCAHRSSIGRTSWAHGHLQKIVADRKSPETQCTVHLATSEQHGSNSLGNLGAVLSPSADWPLLARWRPPPASLASASLDHRPTTRRNQNHPTELLGFHPQHLSPVRPPHLPQHCQHVYRHQPQTHLWKMKQIDTVCAHPWQCQRRQSGA